MKKVARRLVRVMGAVALIAAGFLAVEAPVPGQTPTQEQLQIFQGLSPDQQDAILKSISGAGASGTGLGSGTSTGLGVTRPGQIGTGLLGTDQQNRLRKDPDEEMEPAIPVLKADDWVIVEIAYRLAPRPLSYGQSQYAGQLVGQQALLGGIGASPPIASSPDSATLPATQGVAAASPDQSTAAAALHLSDDDKVRLDALMDLVRSRNPYRLSHEGALTLPGFRPIALLGLTEEQATLRLKVEPTLHGLDVRITRLPLKKTGAEGLKPFGYELFDQAPSTFAPVTNVPLPSDYIVGPGDELNIQLYGNQNRSLKLVVSRDGRINFPELGPLSVGGQSFRSVKDEIESRVQRQMIGIRASVSMADTGAIRVYVFGEARRPGSYTISALGTMTSALYAAGGVKRVGSLRNIQLKRRGALVHTLDMYDLLINGSTASDSKLQQGDVVFIPPVGNTVSVDGEVRRPAIYEIRNEASVADVVRLAGGLTPQADLSRALVTRIDEGQRRVVLAVNLTSAAATEAVRNGDELRVMKLRPTLDAAVEVEGYVFRPGTFAYRPGIRLTDVIHSVDELRPDADSHYLLIRREVPPDRHIVVLSANLAAAVQAPGGAADLTLMPRDRITVFDLSTSRDRIIQPLLDDLKLQGTSLSPTAVVRVDGLVKVPGEYPLEQGMRVADLVRAGGGTAESAFGGEAELTRHVIDPDQSRRSELIKIDLAAAMRGDSGANFLLKPFDTLSVKETPLWQENETIKVKGEVRFPGEYSIRRGETLAMVLARAGGLTKFAFPEGAVFTRETLRKREQEQIDLLADRTQRDLTVLALQSAAAGQGGGAAALSVGQTLLSQLRTAKAVGRMVIDLPHLVHASPGSPVDVILRGGDELIVPRFQQQVTVLGEVQNSTSHLYRASLSRDDYVAMSGGTTRRADRSHIYVVRADGSVVAQDGSRWFQHRSNVAIRPGDTVVVPLDTEHMPALPFWQAVTSILYNVAIAVAAVHAL